MNMELRPNSRYYSKLAKMCCTLVDLIFDGQRFTGKLVWDDGLRTLVCENNWDEYLLELEVTE